MSSAVIYSAATQAPRSALKRSRSEANDSAGSTTLDQQSKRQRVTFSANVASQRLESQRPESQRAEGHRTDIQRTADRRMESQRTERKPLIFVEKPLSLVKEEVRVTLARHRNDENELYDNLLVLFTTNPTAKNAPSLLTYRKHLAAITSQAFLLGRDLECTDLLKALLGSYWLERDEQSWVDFQRFLASLLTVHTVYLPTIVNWLVTRLSEFGPTATGVSRELFHDRIHRTLLSISKYVPTLETLVDDSVKTCFPHHRSSTKSYIAYIRNILMICTYFPDLQARVVRVIIDKAVGLDANVGSNIDGLDDDDLEMLEKQLREETMILLASEDADSVKSAEDEDDLDPTQALLESVKIMKDDMIKLDVVVGLLFEHFQGVLSKEVSDKVVVDGISSLSSSSTFNTLIHAFQDGILTTWTSRHTQYLLFRFSQLQAEFYKTFTDSLLKIAFDKYGATPIRMSAISYLASFVARAARVTDEDVLLLFRRFARELDKMRKKYEAISRGPDPEQFRFYYTVFQGCMYIFCFRWKAFILNPDDDESEGWEWHTGVKDAFNLNMHSKLNPLKVCSPIVTEQFAKVTQCLDFLYVYSILETNKRVRLTRVIQHNSIARETALTMNSTEASLKLEAHYAFEPYVLPLSKDWVKGLYVSFDKLAPPGFSMDDSSDEEEEEG